MAGTLKVCFAVLSVCVGIHLGPDRGPGRGWAGMPNRPPSWCSHLLPFPTSVCVISWAPSDVPGSQPFTAHAWCAELCSVFPFCKNVRRCPLFLSLPTTRVRSSSTLCDPLGLSFCPKESCAYLSFIISVDFLSCFLIHLCI